eukprot:363813-Chlamydomonas_euryale.AAC.2
MHARQGWTPVPSSCPPACLQCTSTCACCPANPCMPICACPPTNPCTSIRACPLASSFPSSYAHINQTANQPANKPTKQQAKQSSSQTSIQSANQSFDQPSKHQTNKLTNQPTDRLTNQPSTCPSQGDVVLLSQGRPSDDSTEAVVVDFSSRWLRVAVPADKAPGVTGPGWRVDL